MFWNWVENSAAIVAHYNRVGVRINKVHSTPVKDPRALALPPPVSEATGKTLYHKLSFTFPVKLSLLMEKMGII